MARIISACAGLMLLVGLASAQQDPDDPGIQDSIIVESVYVDSGATSVLVRIYAETDDSVGVYNFPLAWHAPQGGIHPVQVLYHDVLLHWELTFDEIFLEDQYIRMVGVADVCGPGGEPPMLTGGERVHFWTVRFVIDPTAPEQIVTIDTTFDEVSGSLLFGLVDGYSEITPAFVPGYIYYGTVVGVGEESPQVPRTGRLRQNYPNPFNAGTTIEFELPSDQNISLEVYNLLGQRVATLLREFRAAGRHTVRWDGRDDAGRQVSSGIYVCSLATSDDSHTLKIVVLR